MRWIAAFVLLSLVSPARAAPTSPGLDLRYWKPAARKALEECLKPKIIAPTFFSEDRLTSCLATVRRQFGDPCQAATTALCLSFDYRESACGREDLARNGNNRSWVCYGQLKQWWSAYSMDPGVSPQWSQAPEGTDHPGSAVRVLRKRAPVNVSRQDVQTAPITGSTAPAALKEPGYAQNGTKVESCDEYAWDLYSGYAALNETAGNRADAARVFVNDRLYPTVRTQLKDRLNRNLAAVQWTWAGAKPPTDGPGIPQNVYAYLKQVAEGGSLPPHMLSLQGLQERMRPQAHYTLGPAWHRSMADAARAAQRDDHNLEDLRQRQETLWADIRAYAGRIERKRLGGQSIVECSRPDPVTGLPQCREVPILEQDPELDAVWAGLMKSLTVGANAGCLPARPGDITACDWAPSYFRDAYVYTYASAQKAAAERCRHQVAGEVDNTKLNRRFRHASMRFIDGTNRTCPARLHAPFDYQASPLALDRFRGELDANDAAFVDCLSGARDWIKQQRPLASSWQWDKHESNEHVGTKASFLTHDSCVGDPEKVPIVPNPIKGAVYDVAAAGNASASAQVPLLKVIEGDPHIVEKEWPRGSQISPGVDFAGGISIKNQTLYEPGRTTKTKSVDENVGVSLSLTWSIPIPAGPVMVVVKLGFAGRTGMSWQSSHVVESSLDPNVLPEDRVTTTLSWTSGPYASVGFFVSAAAAIGAPFFHLDLGVRGSLDVVDFTTQDQETIISKPGNGGGPTCTKQNLSIWELAWMRGSLSIFLELTIDLLFFSESIPIVEWVVATFHGGLERIEKDERNGDTRRFVCAGPQLDFMLGERCHLPCGCSHTDWCKPNEQCDRVEPQNECGVDADGDGALDPETVDLDGCSDDNDHDGVKDEHDSCPDQPGVAARNGCPMQTSSMTSGGRP